MRMGSISGTEMSSGFSTRGISVQPAMIPSSLDNDLSRFIFYKPGLDPLRAEDGVHDLTLAPFARGDEADVYLVKGLME